MSNNQTLTPTPESDIGRSAPPQESLINLNKNQIEDKALFFNVGLASAAENAVDQLNSFFEDGWYHQHTIMCAHDKIIVVLRKFN